MKNILLSLAAAAACTFGVNAEVNYQVFPAPGEVSDLEEVSFVFEGVYEAEIISGSDITASKDGNEITGVRKSYSGNTVVVKLPARVTDAGTYTFTLGAGSVCLWADEDYSNGEDLSETITATYTIAGSSTPDKDWFEFTSNPEPGTVSSLGTVTLTFPKLDDIDIDEEPSVTKNGDAFTAFSVKKKAYESNQILITFDPEVKSAGTYAITFPAYSLTGYGDLGDTGYAFNEPNMEELVLSFEIEAQGGNSDYSYTSDPFEGEVVTEANKVSFSFPSIEKIELLEDAVISVKKDGEAMDASTYTVATAADNASELVVSFSSQLAPGAYNVTLPAGSVQSCTEEGVAVGEPNPDAISVNFTVREPAAPVEYTLTLAFNNPKPDAAGEINIQDRDLSFMTFLSDEPNLDVEEGATITIELMDDALPEEDKFKITVPLTDRGAWGQKTMFGAQFGENPVYNGLYEIRVEKGSFGNADWIEDHETGLSNDNIVLSFTLIGGKQSGVNSVLDTETSKKVIYNLQGIQMDSENLPAGLYIVNGKKQILK